MISNAKKKSRPFGSHWIVLLAFIVAVVIVVTIIIVDNRAAGQDKAATDNWSLIVPAITASDHTMGDLHAPVQVIVYSDFQCQYCGSMFSTVIPRLRQQFGNNIVIAYRHLPLPSEPDAEPEAEASECIYQLGSNGAFWKFARIMYATPHFARGIDLSTLPSIASRSGVDATAFKTCMQEERGKPVVQQETLQGVIAGLSITPSTVLKSQKRALVVVGYYYAPLATAISYLLQTATSSPAQ